METFELRYFLGVAATENLHRASENLRVSPASLSKAVARLEDELSLKLFTREGRGIKLTDQGRVLQRRASEIVQLEEATRLELSGKEGAFTATLAGSEVLLSNFGLTIMEKIKKKYPSVRFEMVSGDDKSALEKVNQGEAQLAIVSGEVPTESGFESRTVGEVRFQTVVGKGHPLYPKAKSGQKISIAEVLKHDFVSTSNPILGQVGVKESSDGWRDGQFPRKVKYLTSSLRTLEAIVENGLAIAYLPDYYSEQLEVAPLNIVDCNHVCRQKIKVVARNPKERSWLNEVF